MRRWAYNWIVIVAIIVHGGWGLLLLVSPQPLNCTPMADSPFRHNQYLAAVVYLVAVGAAMAPWFVRRLGAGFWALACCLPQQFLLMMSAFTAIRCVWRGAYADGVERPWDFILADQLWVIVGMIFHTLALIDWHYWSVRREGVSWNG